MLIDDNKASNYILQRMIGISNFADIVIIKNWADEALQSLKEGSVEPDVIFLDLNMPVMDGFKFLEEFENLPIDKSRIKIFILSSCTNDKEIKKAKENKLVTQYLEKSMTLSQLKEIQVSLFSSQN